MSFFLGFAARRAAPPFDLKCSGEMNSPCAKVFACGENACTAHPRRRPEGRWTRFKMVRPKFEISRLAKKKDTTHVVSFFLGSGRRRRPPPFGIEMLRAAKPPFRRGFACGKTLVRRTRTAGPAGRFGNPVPACLFYGSRYIKFDLDHSFPAALLLHLPAQYGRLLKPNGAV